MTVFGANLDENLVSFNRWTSLAALLKDPIHGY